MRVFTMSQNVFCRRQLVIPEFEWKEKKLISSYGNREKQELTNINCKTNLFKSISYWLFPCVHQI